MTPSFNGQPGGDQVLIMIMQKNIVGLYWSWCSMTPSFKGQPGEEQVLIMQKNLLVVVLHDPRFQRAARSDEDQANRVWRSRKT